MSTAAVNPRAWSHEKAPEILCRWAAGVPLRDIGKEFGISYETVRRIANQYASPEELKAAGVACPVKGVQRQLKKARACKVCHCWIVRLESRGTTCSEECADLYARTRYVIDEQVRLDQLRKTALSVLRSTRPKKDAMIRYAVRRLADQVDYAGAWKSRTARRWITSPAMREAVRRVVDLRGGDEALEALLGAKESA